jgi:hypothetical protein
VQRSPRAQPAGARAPRATPLNAAAGVAPSAASTLPLWVLYLPVGPEATRRRVAAGEKAVWHCGAGEDARATEWAPRRRTARRGAGGPEGSLPLVERPLRKRRARLGASKDGSPYRGSAWRTSLDGASDVGLRRADGFHAPTDGARSTTERPPTGGRRRYGRAPEARRWRAVAVPLRQAQGLRQGTALRCERQARQRRPLLRGADADGGQGPRLCLRRRGAADGNAPTATHGSSRPWASEGPQFLGRRGHRPRPSTEPPTRRPPCGG